MMLHPATVHFAMVLPLVASVFGVIYLFTRSEGMSKISSRTTLIAAIAMIGVWYTGNDAGKLIYDYLSAEGKHELLEHKELGLYLAIAMSIIALLKIVGCKTKKFALEALAVILLLGTTVTTFLQGKDGGEIVYNFGMPFKAYKIQTILDKAKATAEDEDEDENKVEAYEDAMDEVDSISAKVDKVYGNTPKDDDDEEDE